MIVAVFILGLFLGAVAGGLIVAMAAASSRADDLALLQATLWAERGDKDEEIPW